MDPTPTTTNEGAAAPSLDSPPALQVLRGASTDEQRDRRLCGGFQRGAGTPLCVVAEEGVTGEKPHRKGFSSRACFWLLFARAKSDSGSWAESPESPGVRGRSSRKLQGVGPKAPHRGGPGAKPLKPPYGAREITSHCPERASRRISTRSSVSSQPHWRKWTSRSP